jgi:hypothetical protein
MIPSQRFHARRTDLLQLYGTRGTLDDPKGNYELPHPSIQPAFHIHRSGLSSHVHFLQGIPKLHTSTKPYKQQVSHPCTSIWGPRVPSGAPEVLAHKTPGSPSTALGRRSGGRLWLHTSLGRKFRALLSILAALSLARSKWPVLFVPAVVQLTNYRANSNR